MRTMRYAKCASRGHVPEQLDKICLPRSQAPEPSSEPSSQAHPKVISDLLPDCYLTFNLLINLQRMTESSYSIPAYAARKNKTRTFCVVPFTTVRYVQRQPCHNWCAYRKPEAGRQRLTDGTGVTLVRSIREAQQHH